MDRKRIAQQLREEAAKLIQAADLLDSEAPQFPPRRPVSEETRRKMQASQQKRWEAAKKAAGKQARAKAVTPAAKKVTAKR